MKLTLNQEQRQTLSPQMEQSLRVLQMDNLELEEYVQRISEENPLIEFSPDTGEEQKKELLRRKLELIASEDNRSVVGYDSYYSDDETDPMERLRTPERTMREILLEQIGLLRIPTEEARIAAYVTENLDDNGYLSATVAEMARHSGRTPEQIAAAVRVVQGLEPAGVGASSLSECLLLQLERKNLLTPLMRRLVEGYLPDMGHGRFHKIAAELGEASSKIKECYRLIRELDPKPCACLGADPTVRYIIPDIAVVKFPDHFDLVINDLVSPRITIHRGYLSLLNESPDPQTVQYIQEKLAQADWLKNAILRRNHTLLAIGRAIVDRQVAFFRSGPRHLKPMTLSDIAGMVDLHPSTVSRVANSKYIQCSYGVFPMRAFFSHGLANAADCGEITSVTVKEMLQELIASEDPQKPLSDQALVLHLQEAGVTLSRRTVTKYREQLGIGSSSLRKARR